ncbi:hypothetical protein HMPREF9565_00456 [Cutibacterium acnes HL053PA2]|nr:hypothetical protein HMPREF9576_00472 [Cutibacterium acnes HL110PA2]EFS54622.1 hypothetical protein HMPREF9589_00127 [Cutibacterium acnes HL059PA1]EFS58750.1 hypothetical protein HMPREF9604_01382 [Cutibacterium acnes HL036PA1]EFS69368.1 hypothetical protein HMPREF9616_00972 [Cutibacterium acnes HL007PA1]EFS77096.1 hypothetical protein HMPREF9591_01158 [Cutibacterium acnes HL086PA1]EFS90892.1 hypothetical protein HMPREF9606_00153 [Cutibacterium acnes HL036PA3]EFT21993.1 hypothetical protein
MLSSAALSILKLRSQTGDGFNFLSTTSMSTTTIFTVKSVT